ncbi:MAG: hypothetical protein ACREM2_00220 [Vulcanimicrobiaceae bacterium]
MFNDAAPFSKLLASLACAAALALPLGAAAQVPTGSYPGWDAFVAATEQIHDYTVTIVAHEVLGGRTQDRTYRYDFQRPMEAKSTILDGPGKGSVGVWDGGTTVRGHQGGLLSFVTLEVGVHDPRATDLRGNTIETAAFPVLVTRFPALGPLSEGPGPTIDGQATIEASVTVEAPSADHGLTRETLDLSSQTHLPLRHEGYTGTELVQRDDFVDLTINPGLTAADFQT